MDIATVATLALTVASFLAVALMAFFALKPERSGPKCPRCDKSLRDGDARCPQCGMALERPS
ncbi:MAG: zinc-ribbon domain-containing protein [Chloroflexota bacterium]|nr:zinc-ribbon domain-containing protein [Chloroflexota bacterium]MDE3102088.1 zinc-ribbon domain-containing protein [Chloroflexota bacterium]